MPKTTKTTNRIAVLCTGPSVSRYSSAREDYRMVYAVNDAFFHYACDVWVSIDGGYGGRAKDWEVDLGRAELLARCPEREAKRGLFTVPALCYYLRAEHPVAEVDFYGLDMVAGEVGLSGVEPTARRWRGELEQLRKAWDYGHFHSRGKFDVGAEVLCLTGDGG